MEDTDVTHGGPWTKMGERSGVLDETVAGNAGVPPPRRGPVRFPPGTAVSRYVILDEVGAGGMGIVYSAFDPQLNRKIALKILTPKGTVRLRGADKAATRLMREAQAIARLSHPNVVNVYDVGRHGESVFVAMEFIEGKTLTQWLETEPSLTELRRVFALAGRGLIAAHEAGLVHRDFKPDNVLVSPDGRVRVLDFGLARADPSHTSVLSQVSQVSNHSWPGSIEDSGEDSGELEEVPISGAVPRFRDLGESDVLSSPLTLDDAVVGTPRYMAPEQHAGVGVDGRSDQYSFCVALYQALYKQEPFPANTLRDLVRLKQAGKVEIPAHSGVPGWLESLVLRGLSPRPVDRWPSMLELVETLERDPETARKRWLALGGAALLLVAVAVAVGQRLSSQPGPCEDGASHLTGIWDDAQRDGVRGAILATGLPYAEHTWSEVDRRVQADLDRWLEAYRSNCEATRVRGEQSGELLDLRMRCLDDHLAEVRAVLEVLDEPDAAGSAVSMVSGFPGLEPCADAELLRARIPPPQDEETAQRVEAVRQALRDSGARRALRRVEEARSMAEAALAEAETLGYEPLRVEAMVHMGNMLEQAGEYPEAEAKLREAIWAALRIGHDEEAARAAINLVSVVGDRLARYQEGLTWSEQAEALLDRVGEHGRLRASLLNNIGNVQHRMGDNDQALASYEAAIALREELAGADDPGIAIERINLGNAQMALGRPEAALATYKQAEEALTETLGPGHPQIAMAVASIGLAYNEMGRSEEALVQHRAALEAFEESLGPEHLFVATTIGNIGSALRELGRLDEAMQHYRKAQALYEKSLGPDHPNVASALYNMGETRADQGLLDEAVRLHERALAMRRKRFDEDSAQVVASRASLADLQRRRGEAGQAVVALEALTTLAERAELEVGQRGSIHFLLAQARWDAGQPLPRVRADVDRGRSFLQEAGAGGRTELRELEAWARAHATDDRPRDADGTILPAPVERGEPAG